MGLHLYFYGENPLSWTSAWGMCKEWHKRKSKKKSPAPVGIWTHDLIITRHGVYRGATTPAHLASQVKFKVSSFSGSNRNTWAKKLKIEKDGHGTTDFVRTRKYES